jgi:hypothetical protein
MKSPENLIYVIEKALRPNQNAHNFLITAYNGLYKNRINRMNWS